VIYIYSYLSKKQIQFRFTYIPPCLARRWT